MANFIDTTYFIAELNIPSSSLPIAESFIPKYEKQYLIKLLGITLYDEFIAGLGAGTIDPIWTNLKNQIVDSVNKISPIANFVYYYFLDDSVQTTVQIGMASANAENASMVSAIDKQVRGWNEMSHCSRQIYTWASTQVNTDGSVTYPDLQDKPWFNSCYKPYWNYGSHDTYYEWDCELVSKNDLFYPKNRLGI